MIARIMSIATTERRATTLAVIIIAQALCALFFLSDVIADFAEGGHLDSVHLVAETIVTVALTVGVIYLMLELRQLLVRMDHMEIGLRAARGEMVEVIRVFFDRWKLSPAERDVALFLIKGLDNGAIASLRGTAKGTIRAQSTAIYAKAGVVNRAQLVSVFLEELLANDEVPTMYRGEVA